jgi:diadenosine tetraphosphate (Ap4A) HIT family hydrolase
VSDCPFCARVTEGADILYACEVAVAFPDAFPVSEGHLLVVPRRHLGRVEDLRADEWSALFALVQKVCQELSGQEDVDGVNIGVNSGALRARRSITPMSMSFRAGSGTSQMRVAAYVT